MKKIKSFEEACALKGIEPVLPEVSLLMPVHQKSIIAFYKLSVIIGALNEDWQADFSDWDQPKYYNWWYAGSYAGLGCSHASYAPSSAVAYIGSRLCFKSRALAEYAAENFKDLYQDYLLFT